MTLPGISVIIATWNGKGLLEKNLPALFKALENYQGVSEVIVVDDAGTDDTRSFLKNRHPAVRYFRLPVNVGNGQAMNEGAKVSRYEVLFFLDNDVTVTEDFLETLIPHFEDPKIFSAGSRSISSSQDPGPFQFPRVRFRWGIFWYYYETLPSQWERPVPALFASAGHAAFRRKMFEQLEGFDQLYGRFYLEDLDLCYRAWKRGWTSLIDPRSRVVHEAAGTIRKILSEEEIQRRQWRNRFLFTWKNIHSPSLILQHLVWTPVESLMLPFMGKKVFTLAFLEALGHAGRACQRRRWVKRQALLSDNEVLRKLGCYQENENRNAS